MPATSHSRLQRHFEQPDQQTLGLSMDSSHTPVLGSHSGNVSPLSEHHWYPQTFLQEIESDMAKRFRSSTMGHESMKRERRRSSTDSGNDREPPAPTVWPQKTEHLLEERSVTNKSELWRPGFWRQFPWLGVGGLVIACLGMLVSIVILRECDGQPVKDWKVQPTVIVAVVATVSNISLAFALSTGVAISWWYVHFQDTSSKSP